MATIKDCEDLQLKIREQQDHIRNTVEATKDCDNDNFAQYVRDVMDEDFATLEQVYDDLEKTKLHLSRLVGNSPAP